MSTQTKQVNHWRKRGPLWWKVCCGCGIEKPHTEYRWASAAAPPAQRPSRCRQCEKAADRIAKYERRAGLRQDKYNRWQVEPGGDRVKRCSRCGVVRPESEFYLHARGDGHRKSECKHCTKRAVMAWKRKQLSAVRGRKSAGAGASG